MKITTKFRTVGGAIVELSEPDDVFEIVLSALPRWDCHGCKVWSDTKGWLHVTRDAETRRRWLLDEANKHAAQCRVLPGY